MKTILLALILLAAVPVPAEDSPQPATNSVTNTNETGGYKPRQANSKTDARTGATRRAKKQK